MAPSGPGNSEHAQSSHKLNRGLLAGNGPEKSPAVCVARLLLSVAVTVYAAQSYLWWACQLDAQMCEPNVLSWLLLVVWNPR